MALTGQLTLDEFLKLPAEKPRLEYERGMVTQKLEPGARHGLLRDEVVFLLKVHGHEDRSVFSFPGAYVTWRHEDVSYVPDVVVYCRERVPIDADGCIADDLEVPPDMAVEVSAPGQGLTEQLERCRWYVSHGVSVAVLIRLDRRAIWTFRRDVEVGPLRGSDVVDLGDVIPGFSFVVDNLFGALRPSQARAFGSALA
jgi:Uma2 family endonuclease